MKPLHEIAAIVERSPGGYIVDRNWDGVQFMYGSTRPGFLFVIASTGGGWDHVSVSRRNKTPSWDDMERVRKLVTAPDEVWVQYGMPPTRHVNAHPYCLHWWRPQDATVPTPPPVFV